MGSLVSLQAHGCIIYMIFQHSCLAHSDRDARFPVNMQILRNQSKGSSFRFCYKGPWVLYFFMTLNCVSAKFSCVLEAVVASVHFHCFQYQTQGLSHRKIEQCLPLFGCLQRVRFHTAELCDCVKMISPTALQKCASALIKRDLSERLCTGLNG